METCQARYHQLSEKNKALQTEVANLEAQCSKLQTERNQSEQELVFLDKEVPVLFAKQRKLSQPPPTAGQQLAALADRTEGLDFDAKSGAISLTPAVFFRAGTELKVEAGDRLGTLATVLSEPGRVLASHPDCDQRFFRSGSSHKPKVFAASDHINGIFSPMGHR